MSGGTFDYAQYGISDIVEKIEEILEGNSEINGESFDEEVLNNFREAVTTLKRAQAMATRVDYLLSGDDGVDSFKKLWKETCM